MDAYPPGHKHDINSPVRHFNQSHILSIDSGLYAHVPRHTNKSAPMAIFLRAYLTTMR